MTVRVIVAVSVALGAGVDVEVGVAVSVTATEVWVAVRTGWQAEASNTTRNNTPMIFAWIEIAIVFLSSVDNLAKVDLICSIARE